tara:strand:- start:730 stop:1059 length:330 start_codon:yes stop_codon:yes gene_type:complete
MNKSNKNLLYAGVVIAALAYFFRDKSEVSTTDSATNGGSGTPATSGGGATVETSGGGTGTPATSGGGATVETSGGGTGTPTSGGSTGTPTSGGSVQASRDSAGDSYYSA